MSVRVSIIIPCYGQAQYLRGAINSALNQSYPNVEIIVVNDGSPDNTRDVAHGYRDKVVYLEQKNKGLAAARNSGVAISSGAWLQFLDADDLLYRHKIEWQLRDLLKNGARLGYCCTANFGDSAVSVNKAVICPGQIENMFLALAWVGGFSPIPIHSVLMAREVFDKHGSFPEDMRANEDRLFFAKVAFAGERFHFTPIVGAFYRQHARSMKRDSGRMLEAHYQFLRTVWELSCDAGVSQDATRNVIMRSLLNVVDTYAERGCDWKSLQPVLKLYWDISCVDAKRTFQRLLPPHWLGHLWLLKRRLQLRL
jgi:glycosyltransferase involved in cell wall biosynthesis